MREIVINTGPIIGLVAATNSLEWLSELYDRVLVPGEVEAELQAGGALAPELRAVKSAGAFLEVMPVWAALPTALLHELDSGEASVIHGATMLGVGTVAIDEKAGRRIARLHGLQVTGSIGILLKAKRLGAVDCLAACFERMRKHGIWLSQDLISAALKEAGE